MIARNTPSRAEINVVRNLSFGDSSKRTDGIGALLDSYEAIGWRKFHNGIGVKAGAIRAVNASQDRQDLHRSGGTSVYVIDWTGSS